MRGVRNVTVAHSVPHSALGHVVGRKGKLFWRWSAGFSPLIQTLKQFKVPNNTGEGLWLRQKSTMRGTADLLRRERASMRAMTVMVKQGVKAVTQVMID